MHTRNFFADFGKNNPPRLPYPFRIESLGTRPPDLGVGIRMKNNTNRLLCSLFAVATIIAVSCVRAETLTSAPAIKNSPAAAGSKTSIDACVRAKYSEGKIAAAKPCTDYEFLRRAYLDVIGDIPRPEEVKAFLGSSDSAKRAKLIDTLLADERYANHWTAMWSDLLRDSEGQRKFTGYRVQEGRFREWVRDALKTNKPYDQFVKELLTADGRIEENGAGVLLTRSIIDDTPNFINTTAAISQVFMGSKMACAQCHDHPFDKWTQKDFHSLVAFFESRTDVAIHSSVGEVLPRLADSPKLSDDVKSALKPIFAGVDAKTAGWNPEPVLVKVDAALGKEKAAKVRELYYEYSRSFWIEDKPAGEYFMPADFIPKKEARGGQNGKKMEPYFPWDPSKKAPATGSRRAALAEFLTGSRQFAAVHVNRLWARLFGKGIVNPVDEFTTKNTPSNPELLNCLADELIGSKFDTKHVLKLMLTSDTYALSSHEEDKNDSDNTCFSHHAVRQMSAEQLLDSLTTAIDSGENGVRWALLDGTDSRYLIQGIKTPRASDIPCLYTSFTMEAFMDIFDRPDHLTVTVERTSGLTARQALEMLNSDFMARAVSEKFSPRIKRWHASTAPVDELAKDIFLVALARSPSASELAAARGALSGNRNEGIEDLFFALLNSCEFRLIK